MLNADLRPVLLELLALVQRANGVYRTALLRSPSTLDVEGLADFCDWADAAVDQGRALLADSASRGGLRLAHRPPPASGNGNAALIERILARRALRTPTPLSSSSRHRPRPGGRLH